MGISTRQPRELSLFSGAGGGLLGAQILGWETVCYVEWDEYCQSVLQQRIADGWLDDAPIWDDAQTFDGTAWRGYADILTAGFPCQPFSLAGKRRGSDDDRDMWPDTARVICEVRPSLVFLENVPGLRSGKHGYFGHVLGDLSEIGYDAVWSCISAAGCGAPHRRERLWALAWDTDADRRRLTELTEPHGQSQRRVVGESGDDVVRLRHVVPDAVCEGRREDAGSPRCDGPGQIPGDVANTVEVGRRRRSCPAGRDDDHRKTPGREEGADWPEHGRPNEVRRGHWPVEPAVGRVAHGVAKRVDRLRALGNGQVAHQMALAWTLLSGQMRLALDGEMDLKFPLPLAERGLDALGFDARQVRKAAKLGIEVVGDIDRPLTDIPYVGEKTAETAKERL